MTSLPKVDPVGENTADKGTGLTAADPRLVNIVSCWKTWIEQQRCLLNVLCFLAFYYITVLFTNSMCQHEYNTKSVFSLRVTILIILKTPRVCYENKLNNFDVIILAHTYS